MNEEQLYRRVAEILEEARGQVARTVNTAMVHAYWMIGREIVVVEQEGKERAGYGDELMKRLAGRLTAQFGKGFNLTSLKRMRQFFRAFPEGSAVSESLGGPPKSSAARHLSDGAEKGASLRHLSAPARRARGAHDRDRPLLRQERRDGEDHAARGQRADRRGALSHGDADRGRCAPSWRANATRRSACCGW